jgi:hypothetical protein
VSSTLLDRFYPEEYLKTNLDFLKSNAALAVQNGLVPGLHINSPRSMPEEFWKKYPFLRGARIDHPRESFKPRYTLAVAHPVVQQHYRELVRNIMKEVPQLGFIHLWTNDSGSGFEFVSSLYAGRNGGPYLIREWKGDDEIARAAAQNVLTYFRLLRDEARSINPAFRVICDLGPFYSERKYIVPGLGNGLDAGEFGSFEATKDDREREALKRAGAAVHQKLDLCDNNIPGVPFPFLVYERLQAAAASGATHLLTNSVPHSVAPYDVNGEVLRSFQSDPVVSIEDILLRAARTWVGPRHAEQLVSLWRLSDTAVQSSPPGIPFSTFAFPWFRLWVRPFVPNIDAIPESDRSYYEKYLLATFNNPTRVDLNNDMMWNFLTAEEAGQKKETIDREVLPPLDKAVDEAGRVLGTRALESSVGKAFEDTRDRLRAARCFYSTMRNSVAWTQSVHGFMDAQTPPAKMQYRAMCRAMVENELENTRNLLRLWNESTVDWMPVSQSGESLHIYDGNFGDHLHRKIALMERHMDDEPNIDPNYMWRMK